MHRVVCLIQLPHHGIQSADEQSPRTGISDHIHRQDIAQRPGKGVRRISISLPGRTFIDGLHHDLLPCVDRRVRPVRDSDRLLRRQRAACDLDPVSIDSVFSDQLLKLRTDL